MKNQSIYLYIELEGAELEIEPLHTLFAKCSCYASPVGDTYYTYNADGEKRARKRTAAYFQARIEYNSGCEDPLNDVILAFLNMYCYDGAPLRGLIPDNDVKLWCSVSSDQPTIPMTIRQDTMRKLLDVGLDICIKVVQNGRIAART